ncbi:MAG TPA: four helix bundle protein [Deltaproteobacteria bacterium]|nr:four helix bundle protein [Deltaproteobacteria bacterium]
MEIYKASKTFPPDEKYSLTDQIRRSSRAVYANLSYEWRKRRYKGVFIYKLTDAAQEAAETKTCHIDKTTFARLDESYEHISAMRPTMAKKADAFCH